MVVLKIPAGQERVKYMDILDRIREKMDATNFSGAVLVKMRDGNILEEVRGYQDRSDQILNKIRTKFGIASGTKIFTALGIMRLVEQKKISLDEPAFPYIPVRFPTYDPTVTIKHLLTHSSGIPDYYDEETVDSDDFKMNVPLYELLKPTDYLSAMPQTQMKSKPGAKFIYNNSAFVFLSVIIEQLTGDYHEWINKEVLRPANMHESGFFMFNQLPNNCANGYIDLKNGLWKTNIYNLPIIGGGDGGMFSTAHDLIQFWENLGQGNIINHDSLQQVLKPHMKGNDVAYGLGIWLARNQDTYVPYLEGCDAGVSFKSYYNLPKKIIASVLSNTTNGAWEITPLLKEIVLD